MNDIAKEVVVALDYFENNLIERIPTKFLDYLSELAITSNKNVYIDTKKELIEQNISECSKDLIALIYYNYIADKDEKQQILKLWIKNEKTYKKELEEKYNLNNIFKSKIENEQKTNLPIESKKGKISDKILNFIRNIFNKT